MTPANKTINVDDLCIDTETELILRYVGEGDRVGYHRGVHQFALVNSQGSHRFYTSVDMGTRVQRLYRYKDTLSGLIEQGGKWADRVYPHRKPWDTLVRLSMRELPELWAKPDDVMEIADALILVCDIAYQQRLDAELGMREKMAINEDRNWEFRDDGLMYHVPNNAEPDHG